MPNHVTNIVQFRGSKKDLKKLREAVKGTDTIFSFNSFYPIPKELLLTFITSPIQIVSQEEYEKYLIKKNNGELGEYDIHPITQEMQDRFIKEYGADNWYDWCCDNWGTKWDCYNIFPEDEFTDLIEFNTAWATPYNAMLKLSSLFPNVEIKVKYYDESIGDNIGEYVFKNGEVTDEVFATNIEEGLRLYLDITGDSDFFSNSLSDYFNSDIDEDTEIDAFTETCIKIACELELKDLDIPIKDNVDFSEVILNRMIEYSANLEKYEYANYIKKCLNKLKNKK